MIGQIPAELGNLVSLLHLYLSENRLTGEIPPELGALANLQHLYLHNNQLDGPIPTRLGELTNLRELILWRNRLTGEIPVEFGRLTELRLLHLDRNYLTGPIPHELGNLLNLRELYLWQNRLTGPIPIELGRLIELRYLHLDRNELTGEIPAALVDLTNLLELYLSRNMLTGCIPAGLRGIHVGDVFQLPLPFCDVLLSGLITDPETLTPAFDAYHTSYISEVNEPRVTVTPTSDHGANVQLLGLDDAEIADADESLDGHQIDLVSTVTVIRIVVSAPDGMASNVYVIEATRADLNTAPVFSDGEGNPVLTTVRTVAENTPAVVNIGEPMAATDVDEDSLTHDLDGADAGSFDLDRSTGQLRTKAPLDYETRAAYTIEVAATDRFGVSATITVTIEVTDVTTGSALGDRYDADENGVIDRDETIAAISDYLAGRLARDDLTVILGLHTSS